MRSSTSDYARPNKGTDRVVSSYNGYTSYLLIIDEASRYAWVFLTTSKDPPIDIICAFLLLHGHPDGGCIRTDQGGELASSIVFCDLLLQDFRYTLEPTGADSPSQNGAIEIHNDKFFVFRLGLFFTVRDFLQNTGPQPSFMQSTFTIVWSIQQHLALLLNIITN
jgi:hypothetical protein